MDREKLVEELFARVAYLALESKTAYTKITKDVELSLSWGYETRLRRDVPTDKDQWIEYKGYDKYAVVLDRRDMTVRVSSISEVPRKLFDYVVVYFESKAKALEALRWLQVRIRPERISAKWLSVVVGPTFNKKEVMTKEEFDKRWPPRPLHYEFPTYEEAAKCS